jgi:O-antigen/teichoic acid export membrane protein
MDGLGQKTAKSIIWSALERGSTQGTNFLVGIVLARILPPEDFGLIAMLTIFMALSSLLTDSGFGKALIRKKNKSNVDFSSVFYFNIIIGLVCYLLMYISAPLIADFYDVPLLSKLLRYLGLTVIFNSFIVVHNAILVENLNFKFIAVTNFIAVIIGGGLSIWAAYRGVGIWALVIKNLIQYFIASLLIISFSKWHPKRLFSFRIIRELFGFGSKLLISGFAYTIIGNLSNLLIGKFFSSRQLGYYSRGAQFSDLLASMFQSVVLGVSFPALAHIADEKERFVNNARKMINSGAIVICFALCLFAIIAKPFVLLFLTEKWLPAVPIIQMLCVARAITSVGIINLNMLQAVGRSDLSLKVDMIKIPLNILAIIIGIKWGIKGVAIGQIILSLLCFYINTYYTKKLFDYGALRQFKDLSLMIIALLSMAIVSLSAIYFTESNILKLLLGIFIGCSTYFFILYKCRVPDFLDMIQRLKIMVQRK